MSVGISIICDECGDCSYNGYGDGETVKVGDIRGELVKMGWKCDKTGDICSTCIEDSEEEEAS